MSKFRGMPNFGGGFNINKLMKEAQKMQKDLESKQSDLEKKIFESSVGGGAVYLKTNGKKEILDLKIKKEVVDPEDVETLEDLIKLALEDAFSKIDKEAEENMEGLNIPGL